jgi:hypothetical protein
VAIPATNLLIYAPGGSAKALDAGASDPPRPVTLKV